MTVWHGAIGGAGGIGGMGSMGSIRSVSGLGGGDETAGSRSGRRVLRAKTRWPAREKERSRSATTRTARHGDHEASFGPGFGSVAVLILE